MLFMKSFEIRRKYIEFFKKNNHEEIINFSLIPENDPTVLFTTAGMHPLVPYLLGQKHPQGTRLVNYQICIRTQDIDEVGDNTHLTFFEMLGNWSLGNYWKDEAIRLSFKFLTVELKIPKERLAISIFKGNGKIPKDKESESIWLSLGIKKERIKELSDNWWGPAGSTGPCGPDTEMFVYVNGKAPKEFDPKDKNWVEIWNDVFMEYNKTNSGYEFLRQKNVDTGFGIERAAMVLQNKSSVYETDLFENIVRKINSMSKGENENSLRIIADHLRASCFILAELVKPSNTEHGYILRRLLRRSMRHARLLGIKENFIPEILDVIIEDYEKDYPLLRANREFILTNAGLEEEKFQSSLEKGLQQFKKMNFKNKISGEDAFYLYQSFGFPLEITKDLAGENKLKIDEETFNREFEKHQEVSRKGAEQKFKSGLADHSEETTKLHTATHLLFQALRNNLGREIKQMGSNITKERLRFDFSFPRALTKDELKKIEDEVNWQIRRDLKVSRTEMPFNEAMKKGVNAFFREKYPEVVSVYIMGDYSKEVCTGPHVVHTGVMGHFKIQKEQSSSSGIRRIKAILE